jgi:guanylate kinase
MQGEGYQPSGDVLNRLKQVDFVAVVGPTAAGKTTLIHSAKARDSRIHEVMNNTSRSPRRGEQDGIDFTFKSRSEMMAAMQAHEYVQVLLHPSGDIYATAGSAYSTEGISVLPVLSGVMPTFHALPFKRMRIIYILPPNWDTWMARMASHGFTPEQHARRLVEARESLTFAINDPQVYFIVNEDLEEAITAFMSFLIDNSSDAEGQGNARILASELLMQLIK